MTGNAYGDRFEPHPTRVRSQCEMCERPMWLSGSQSKRYRTCGEVCRQLRYKSLRAEPLTHVRLMTLIRYVPETGEFFRMIDGNSALLPINGTLGSHGYLSVSVAGRECLLHRLAWFYMTGEWPINLVDHRDTNSTNNRWLNLRAATFQINNENERKARKNSASGLLGAFAVGNRWRSQIKVDRKALNLGRFDTAEEAHAAYVVAKRQFHGGCTL